MLYLRPHVLTKSLAGILVFTLSLIAQAQDLKAADEPGIVILKYSWNSYRPGWDRRLTGGMGPVRDKSGQINPPVLAKGTPPARLGYQYKSKFANRGQREVRVIVWEYRFIDKTTGESTAHRFRSVLKLKPGVSRELREFSYTQPVTVTDINIVGKKYKEVFEEEVKIIRVEYADASVWTAE